jgi:hypothetical protein
MNKMFVFVIIMLCVVLTGTAFTAAQGQTVSAEQKSVLADRNGDTRIDGIDIYNKDGGIVKRGYDTNGDMVIDKWETYDENTGMPIVTESDKAFEL